MNHISKIYLITKKKLSFSLKTMYLCYTWPNFLYVFFSTKSCLAKFNFKQVFLQLGSPWKMRTLDLVFLYMWLNMSSNRPILEPKIQTFVHLGLSWPKPLRLGVDRMFFLVLQNFKEIFSFLWKRWQDWRNSFSTGTTIVKTLFVVKCNPIFFCPK